VWTLKPEEIKKTKTKGRNMSIEWRDKENEKNEG